MSIHYFTKSIWLLALTTTLVCHLNVAPAPEPPRRDRFRLARPPHGSKLGQQQLQSSSVPVPEPARLQRFTRPGPVPEGLSAADWSSIRQQYDQHRHAAVPVNGTPNALQARNPGQQWETRFDGRGFITRPEAGGWQWGLELRSYGFVPCERAVGGQPRSTTTGQRVAYDWDATLQEWFINDVRGLEHGFTAGDGRSNLQEYRDDTDPATPP